MRSFRAKSGPFEEQLRFSTDEIDQICRDALAKEKLLPAEPEPIRIERFVEKHFGCAVDYQDIGDGVLGCTLFNPKGAVLAIAVSSRINDYTTPGQRRERSTIAHEAGHGLMHTSLFMPSPDQGRLGLDQSSHENLDLKQKRILCRDADIRYASGKQRTYDGRWWEWQANRAIGGLLLPKALVQKALAGFLCPTAINASGSLPNESRSAAADHLADVFDVNPAVARIRLDEMYPDAGAQLEF